MAAINILRTLALSALLLPSAGVFAAMTKAEMEQAMSGDGLQQTTVRGVDLAYARPGATLAAYNRVQFDPVEVSFSKNWDPLRTGSRLKLSAAEREDIRTGLVAIVQEEFVNELQRKDGYPIASEAAPDVLRVRAHVADVYVNAPDTMTAGRSRTYTASAGEATIHLELLDSQTGQVIVRMVDRREARGVGAGMLSISNSVTNAGDARDVAAAWARILRSSLDKAHSSGRD